MTNLLSSWNCVGHINFDVSYWALVIGFHLGTLVEEMFVRPFKLSSCSNCDSEEIWAVFGVIKINKSSPRNKRRQNARRREKISFPLRESNPGRLGENQKS